jgi:hypothetical protein
MDFKKLRKVVKIALVACVVLCACALLMVGRPLPNGMKLKFNPSGGRYGLCLHEVRLLGPNDN